MLYGDFSGKILIRNVTVPPEERPLLTKDGTKGKRKERAQGGADGNFNPELAVKSGEESSETSSDGSPDRHMSSNKSLTNQP